MVKKIIPPLFLIVIVFLVAVSNYSPGTVLSGWDNLHPEFNFPLNIKRSIFAVWQEYQGLGLLGGMGHAADLPRQLLLWIFSILIPVNALRYLYAFLMLFVGPLGMYFLLKDIILEKSEVTRRTWGSLLGALFYLLNLATIQNFYFPFEPFLTHYGFLPFLFWAFLKFLKNPVRKNLLIFIMVNILAVPQGYVPTIFLVYLIFLVIFVVLLFVQLRERVVLKNSLMLLILTLMINAFWLLPFLYFTKTNSQVTVESKTNQIYTGDAFARNQKYGHLKDAIILRGFWFDNTEPMGDRYDYIMIPWRYHVGKYFGIGVFIFMVILTGIIFALKKRENKILLSFLGIFLFSFMAIANADFPFNYLNNFLRQNIPLFSQVFRFPFMKFSTVLSFSYAIFFVSGVLFFIDLVKIFRKNFLEKVGEKLVFILAGASLIIFIFPVFRGNLFYFKVRSNIPNEYFELFKYLNSKDKTGRIANLPQASFNGWSFYRFNYSGSGFLWYGIEQPILDRAFDVWSREDENYYWEVSYALYSRNVPLLEKVLEKYQIAWLLIDENILSLSSVKSLFFDQGYDLIGESSKINLEATFGQLKLYRYLSETPVNNSVFVADNLPEINPSYKWGNYDRGYSEDGDYFTNLTTDIYYPFRSLFTGRKQEDLEFVIEDKGSYFSLRKLLPPSLSGKVLELPVGGEEELIFINPDSLKEEKREKPLVYLDGQLITDSRLLGEEKEIEVRVPKVEGYFSFQNEPWIEFSGKQGKNCNQFTQGSVQRRFEKDYLRSEVLDALDCEISYWLPNLPHDLSYLLTLKSRSVFGKSFLFWWENLNNRKADIETFLPQTEDFVSSYFVQPPMQPDGLGYSLHFDNSSIGPAKSINDLGKITINQFPYKYLTKIRIMEESVVITKPSYLTNLEVNHPNYFTYYLSFDYAQDKPFDYAPFTSVYSEQSRTVQGKQDKQPSNPVLVLSQSSSPGWKAYKINEKLKIKNEKFRELLTPLLGEEIKEHVLVNNWANGWLIPTTYNLQPTTIILVYLPQYLEFLGFFLGFGTIFMLLLYNRKTE